jgi:predicted nucleic acid-binding Zn ribbon protein
MKKEKARPLGDILGKVVSDLGKKKLAEDTLAGAWGRAAGKKAAKHTRVVNLRRSKLIVNVDASAWLFELTLEKRALLKKINEGLAGKKIKDIRLRIGDIKR